MNKKMMFILCLLILFSMMAVVSASDNNIATSDSLKSDDTNGYYDNLNQVTKSKDSGVEKINSIDDYKSKEDSNLLQSSSNENKLNSTNDDLLSTQYTFAQLNTKITNTAAGGTLNLASSDIYKNTGGYSADGIVISKAITIDGKGATIDGNGVGRIFNINSQGVILKNIIFVNGKHSGNGGAIYISQNGPNFESCTFKNNQATGFGGALYANAQNNIKFNNCYFYNNKANYGGAFDYFGLALTISSCTFEKNTASATGGALRLNEPSSSPVVKTCNFIQNSAVYGSAIELVSGTGTYTIRDSTFTSNSNSAIKADANANLINNAFISSSVTVASGKTVSGQNWWGSNSPSSYTGTLLKVSGSLVKTKVNGNNVNIVKTIFYKNGDSSATPVSLAWTRSLTGNSNVVGNTNYAYYSGTLPSSFTYKVDSQTITISNTGSVTYDTSFTTLQTLINNNANSITLGYGFAYNSAKDSSLSGGVVINKAFTIDGGNYNIDGKSIARIFKITSNSVTLKNIKFYNGAGDNGGAIHITGTSTTLNNCQFIQCKSTNHGAAIYLNSGSVTVSDGITIRNNAASGRAGGIYINSGTFTINSQLNLYENTAVNGGGIYVYSGTLNIAYTSANNVIRNNVATSNGGAIYINDGTVTIKKSNIYSNKATSNGGAIFMAAGGLTIDQSSLYLNNASAAGAAMYMTDGTVTVTNGITIRNNIASGNGAVYMNKGTINFNSQLNLYDNRAANGGGIYVNAGNLNIVYTSANNVIRNNVATSNGGAIYINGGTVTIKKSNIYSNRAVNGGAIYAAAGTLNIDSSSLYLNNASTSGGAIYIDGCTVTISNSNVYSNRANSGHAGAFYVAKSSLTLTSTNIYKNYASSNGGAVAIVSTGSFSTTGGDLYLNNANNAGAVYAEGAATIANALVYNNTATNNGGAVLFTGAGEKTVSGTSTTFEYNVASKGSAMFIQGAGKVTLDSIRFSNNLANVNSITFTTAQDRRKLLVNATFNGGDNFMNAIYVNIDESSYDNQISLNNVVYRSEESYVLTSSYTTIFANTDIDSKPTVHASPYQDFTVGLYDGTKLLKEYDVTSNRYGIVTNLEFDELMDVGKSYNLVATHLKNDYYKYYTTSQAVNITKIYAIFNLTTPVVKYGEDVIIELVNSSTASGLLSLNYTYTLNGVTLTRQINSTVVNGVAVFKFDGEAIPANATHLYDLSLKYGGDVNYLATSGTVQLNVTKTTPTLVINSPSIGYGENATIYFNINGDATGTLIINTTNGEYSITVSDVYGQSNVTFLRPNSGIYTIIATYYGDNNYFPLIVNSTLSVERPRSSLNISVVDTFVGNNVSINFTVNSALSGELFDDAEGKLRVYVGGNYFNLNVTNGKAYLSVPNLIIASYNVVAIYNGDDNYAGTDAFTTFNVKGYDTDLIITVNTNQIFVGESVIVTAKVNETINDDPIYLYVDGKLYNILLTKNGTAVFNVTNIGSGLRNITAVFTPTSSFSGANNYTFVTVVKNNPNFDAEYSADSNRNISIIVNLPSDAAGTITIVGNGTSVIANVTGGRQTISLGQFDVGNFTFDVTYSGDDKYINSSSTGTVEVGKLSDYQMNITTSAIVRNQNVTIFVNLPEEFKNNGTVNLTLPNGTVIIKSLVNGKINYTISTVNLNNINVTAKYSGYGVYASKTISRVFEIKPTMDYEILIIVDDAYVGDNVTIKISAPDMINNITLRVDNIAEVINLVNGNGTYNLSNVASGYHAISVSYDGDDVYYAAKTFYGGFNVTRKVPVITVTASNVTYQTPVIVNVDLGVGDVTGLVSILLDDVVYNYFELVDGKVSFNISGLNAGIHKIVVKYIGDDKYSNATSDIVLVNTSKASNYDMNVYYDSRTVVNGSVVDSGATNQVIVSIELPNDASGNVSLYINDEFINSINATKNLIFTLGDYATGMYNVTVIYAGDNNYNSNKFEFKLNVTSKLAPSLIIVYPDVIYVNSMFNITIDSDVGDGAIVTLYVDGVKIATQNINNNFIINGLSSGNHIVTVDFAGDALFVPGTNSTNINVSKLESGVRISANTIDVGENLIVNVTASGNGSATIYIYNQTGTFVGEYILSINNGYGQIIVPYTFTEIGEYTINITYNGDDLYKSSQNTTSFLVQLATDYEFKIITTDAYVGGDVVVNVTLPSNANKDVTLTLPNGTNVTKRAVNGSASFIISNMAAGDYKINVTYAGDNNYARATKFGKFSIYKNDPTIDLSFNTTDSNIEIINSIVQGDKTIFIIKLVDDATGYVNVTVSDSIQFNNQILVDGKVNITLEDLTYGNYNIKVVYSGDDKYNNSTNSIVLIVASSKPTIEIIPIADQRVDDDVDISIKTNVDMGNVTLYINGVEFNRTSVDNGWANFTIKSISGEYATVNVFVVYEANNIYAGVVNSTTFDVKKYSSSINATSLKNNVTVYLDVNATGNVIVTFNGINYTAIVNDGVGVVSLPNTPGIYLLPVYYSGDLRYYSNKTVVDVSIPWGDDYLLNATVNATGYVTINTDSRVNNITIGWDGLTPVLVNLSVVGDIKIGYYQLPNNLTVGTHLVTVSYVGDGDLSHKSYSLIYNVEKIKDYIFNISAETIYVGDDAVILVNLPDDATGFVVFTINGVRYTIDLADTRNYTVSGLTNGTHNIIAKYLGDDNYAEITNSTNITVSKLIPNIFINMTPIELGDDLGLIIELYGVNVDNATGKLEFTIAGHGTVTVDVINGFAIISSSDLPGIGTYDADVKYLGDNNYDVVTSSITFTISKIDGIVIIVPTNVTIDETLNITVGNESTIGKLNVTIGGSSLFTVDVVDGVAIIPVDKLPQVSGLHDIDLIYWDGNLFVDKELSTTFYSDKIKNYTIVVGNTTVVYGVNASVDITLPDDLNGLVKIWVNGVERLVELTSGRGKLENISNLNVGNNTITVIFTNDKYDNKSAQGIVTVEHANIEMNITVSNIKVGQTETIKLTLPKGIDGGVFVSVDGNKYYVEIINGEGSLNITKLTNGTYTVVAIFEGNEIYNSTNATKQFNVTKVSDYTIHVDYSKVVNNVTDVTIKLPDDATGIVTIIVNNTNFTGVLYKGSSTIAVNNIMAPSYTYTVIYSGDDKYVNGTAMGVIRNDEFRKDSQVIVCVEDIYVDGSALIKVNVTEGATGEVRITVNGKNIIVPLINGSAKYSAGGFTNGTYKVTVNYLGDEIFAQSSNSTTFKVSKYNSSIAITTAGGKVGESITITITGPSDASGIVDVKINGTNYNVVMTDGKAVFNTTFDKYGQYNITANYVGNNKYNPTSNMSSFNIDSLTPSVVISVDDIKVGENALITVYVPNDATGIVTVTVNGADYNVTVNSGKAVFNIPNLANGTYDVLAQYNGDSKYASNTNTSSFNVSKVDIMPDISSVMVDQQANITVSVPGDATGNIMIFVGDDYFISPIQSGIALFNLNNIVNVTNVSFVYAGDDKYNGFNTSAIIYDSGIKQSSSLSIMISNIKVGENATIMVGITDKATGNITIKIGDKILSNEIVGGKVTFIVSDLAYGTYNVSAIYAGDSKFLGSNITSSISVSKHVSNVIVSPFDIKVGETANITVFVVPSDATGNVSIKINGIGQDQVMVSGGKAVFVIPNLGNGTYEVVATYNGDAKYLNSTGNATFKVSKVDINPNVESTSVLDNKTTVTVIVPSDAGGNITIIVGADEYIEQINDGKAIVNVSNVGDGTNITIVYDGDDKYNGFNKTAVVTDKGIRINPSITVVCDKSEYLAGETAVITITVPEDARGNVTIKVNGEIINITDVSQGMVVYNYAVISSGNFNVEVIYNGDNKYGKATNTTLFNASRVNSTVVIDVNSTEVGKSVVIVVYVPDDAAGKVIIVVDSKQFEETVGNGRAVFNIPALAKNNYTVVATFIPSDGKYNGNANSTSFEVTAKSTSLNVVVSPITYGEDAEIVVTVPVNATGYVTITIGDDTYLANIKDGKANFTISNLEPGVVNLEIAYSGDDNYVANTTYTSFTVNPKSATIDVIAGDIDKGDVAVITVIVSNGANGVVVITVGGKDYNTTINEGVASVEVSGLDAGTYNVVAKYLGNKYYANATNDTVSFNVLTDSSVIAKVVSRMYGSDYDYEALFTDKAGNPLVNANVTFAVNGKEYNVVTDENGIARLPGGTLSVGNHTVVSRNPVTGYETYNTTEIKPTLVDNKDINMDFRDGSKYSVRVIGADGKPVGAGVEVNIRINYVSYKVKTDKNGYASLSINLNPGKYTVSVTRNGYKISNEIHVKRTLAAKKTQVAKKSAKISKIKVSLKWSNGKAIKGKKVTMKFRGNLYKAKTNSKGIATFKIPKKGIKNLKPGKTYQVKYTYLTDSIYKYIKIKK